MKFIERIKRSYTILADSVALLLFLCILTIVVLSLYSLSPRSYESTIKDPVRNVLGLQDSVDDKKVLVSNMNFSEFRDLNNSSFESKVYKSDDGFIYSIEDFSNVSAGESIQLFEIYNNSNVLKDYKFWIIMKPVEPFRLKEFELVLDGGKVGVSTNAQAEYTSQFSIGGNEKTIVGVVVDPSFTLIDGVKVEIRIEEAK